MSYIFPSIDIIQYVPMQAYDVNAIIHKKVIVFCDQGEGKTALVRGLVESVVRRYGEENVHAVVSDGDLSELINHGFNDQIVQVHFCDDFTLQKSDTDTLIKTKGELMGVPVNSWIDVRLDMPDDSAFNQRLNQELQP